MTTIYTIGYEGTEQDVFIQTLKVIGIKLLVDIRAVPISRKKGFSKTALKERLQEEEIGYLHLGDLGDPKLGRAAARAGRFDEFVQIYTKHLQELKAQLALRTPCRNYGGDADVLALFRARAQGMSSINSCGPSEGAQRTSLQSLW